MSKETATRIVDYMQAGDVNGVTSGIESICEEASRKAMESVRSDWEAYQRSNDDAILAARGVRKLTSKERAFYGSVIDAMKSMNPKQAFVDILTAGEDAMPTTIIEDVLRGITQEHPLLSKVNAQATGYLTHWVLNAHEAQAAAWGAITDEIAKEITSAVSVVDIKQNKLSCYAVLERGMVDLGPEWLDSYVRAVLTEALSYALEGAVISGTGASEPIGMDRDLDSEISGVYSQKTATAVTDFLPATYGPLVAALAKDAQGKDRSIDGLALIVNNTTYLKRIMPATTYVNALGEMTRTAFPVATEVIVSNAVDDDVAILGCPANYFLAIGDAPRSGVIEYSDEYKFVEDQRVFKVVKYADGRAVDNTAFQLLDVSTLSALNDVVTA